MMSSTACGGRNVMHAAMLELWLDLHNAAMPSWSQQRCIVFGTSRIMVITTII